MTRSYALAVAAAVSLCTGACASAGGKVSPSNGTADAKPGRSQCLTEIVLAGSDTEEPEPARCRPGQRLLVVFRNHTKLTFDVTIDKAADFKIRYNMKPSEPVTSDDRSTTVEAGDIDVLRFRIKKADQFGDGKLPYTTYKYTVHLKWMEGGSPKTYDLDPDVDIPPY